MMKIEKFTDVCMTGGMHYTPSHTNVTSYIFSAVISPQMLKLGRVTKVKVHFLLLVFVFNFDLFKFSAAILEKGLLQRCQTQLSDMQVTDNSGNHSDLRRPLKKFAAARSNGSTLLKIPS